MTTFNSNSGTGSMLTGLCFSATLLVVCGVIYTTATTLVGEQLFSHQATGSVIVKDGKPVGSELIAQSFTAPQYFYARPSAANFDPTGTGGSNLAPSNPELREQVRERSQTIQDLENVAATAIPPELLAASGAGLDPHISPAAAAFQANRIAEVRGLQLRQVTDLIDAHAEGKQLGLFGQPRVNVLKLNLALDAAPLAN